MTITRRMDRNGLVTTEIAGHTNLADILNSVLELGELTAYSNEFWEIVLLDPKISIHYGGHTTLEVAHAAKELIQFRTRGAIAIVAPTRNIHKWSEQVAGILRGDVVPVTVFDDEAPAREWLRIHMENAQFNKTTMRMHNRPGDPTEIRPR